MTTPEGRYFNGTPCHRGHVGRRYTSTGACVDCMALHSKEQNIKKLQQRRLAKEQACASPAP